MSEKNTGRVTIPTNLDVVPETIELMKRWGADAIRDCDGTEFPEELTKTGAKIYATYYTTRKDNAWAKANPDEVQQSYIMTNFYTATGNELQIPLMKGISDELMQVNTRDDRKRWWEVIDRSTGEVVSTDKWEYNEETGCVCIHDTEPFHEYTVSFLAYIIWDPVHMYNAVTNGWKDFEHQITFDVDFAPGIEIGWRLAHEYWGQGYAPEAATACLEYTRNKTDIKELFSFTSLLNQRSERVMQKIGMERIREFDHPLVHGEHPLCRHVLYHIKF